jgi:hypothetical protein
MTIGGALDESCDMHQCKSSRKVIENCQVIQSIGKALPKNRMQNQMKDE